MNTISYAITDQAERAGASEVARDGVLGLFYNRPIMDEVATRTEGRPVFVATPYCKMRFPGEAKKVVDKPAKEEHQHRFPAAWKAFNEGLAGPTGGTPIESYHLLAMTQVAALKHLGIVTVEQLAEVSDGNLNQLGVGGREIRERARAWLKGADAELKTTRQLLVEMEHKLEHLASENQALRSELTKPAKAEKAAA